MVDPKSNPKIFKPFSVSSKTITLIIVIKQLSLLAVLNKKELDTKDFYKRKHMNEEMEAELTKTDSRPDSLVVS